MCNLITSTLPCSHTELLAWQYPFEPLCNRTEAKCPVRASKPRKPYGARCGICHAKDEVKKRAEKAKAEMETRKAVAEKLERERQGCEEKRKQIDAESEKPVWKGRDRYSGYARAPIFDMSMHRSMTRGGCWGHDRRAGQDSKNAAAPKDPIGAVNEAGVEPVQATGTATLKRPILVQNDDGWKTVTYLRRT